MDFEWIYLYPSINKNEQVVFVADPKDGGTFNAALATRKENTAFGSRDYNEAIVPSAFVKPAIADNGTIVARETFSTITLSDYQLNPIAVIANTVSGFNSVGVAPDISSDGRVVAFYGDLTNPGANSTTQGLDAGEGIFISLETDSGREIKRIAGIAGNGILDPGESHNDIDENGEVDPGEDEGFIDDFNLDESVGISFTATDDGGSGAVAYLAIDEDGNENLISSDFNISSEDENEPTQTFVTSKAIAKVGQEASQVSSELSGNIQDLNIEDPINDSGQIAFWTETTTGDEAVIKADPIRKPVFILPGIGGSFPRHEDFGEWLLDRGVAPDTLEIDYLANTYDDLIQTLENAGYQQGVDLFVANYDWRLNPGPIDGNIDGRIERSVEELTDDTFEYAVDQLAFWLEESITGWKSQFADLPEAEIPELDSVDIIAHSTGGLVARSYIQSDAYGGAFTDDSGQQVNLPKVDNFISIGVPNRGASQAWNPIQNNFNTIDYDGLNDFDFRDLVANQGRLLLHSILRSAFQKVTRQNNPETIALSGNNTSEFAINDPNIATLEFIEQYVPTLKSLLATYPFIDLLPNNDNLQSIEEIYPSQRNNLVLDLNNGYDSIAQGTATDPNLFVDDVELATIIYGENEETDDAVRERDEPIREFEVRLPGITTGVPIPTEFPIEANLPQVPVGIWYEDVEGVAARTQNPPEFRGLQGDGTVPWLSSFGQFRNDSRTNLISRGFNQRQSGEEGNENTEESVDHGALVSNTDVQQLILNTLGVSLDEDLISTDLANPSFGDAFGALRNIIFDPVEGFLIDGQGRRLGYTNATGAITEIPGSLWLGETDGFGFIPDAVDLEGPFELQLTGLGEDYFVSVALETEDGLAGIEAEGFLADGEQLTLDIPLTITGSVDNDILIGTAEDELIKGLEGSDRLTGAAGNDTMDGGTGNDTVVETGNVNFTLTDTTLTGHGSDTITQIELVELTGGAGNNVLMARDTTEINVTLDGQSGNDNLVGGAKNDSLMGRDGNDRHAGKDGNDFLNGDDGSDTLYGDDGNDTLNGGDGNDRLLGNADNDILQGEGGNDTINGGAGSDRLVETGNVNFTLTDTTLAGRGSDTITQIELVELTGGAGNNVLMARDTTEINVTLDGQSGNDNLVGGAKNDSLMGRDGNDRHAGKDGNDFLNGDDGSDTLYGDDGNDTLNGGDGNDRLLGNADNDILQGEGGNDTINGGAGSDRLVETGNVNFTLTDTTLAGRGSDTISQIEFVELTGGTGNNVLMARDTTEINVTLDGAAGNDNLVGGAKNDSLMGRDGNDRLAGKNGSDLLDGANGSDTLYGDDGNDTLNGGDGNDRLLGNADNDILQGEGGNDTINGGVGFDQLRENADVNFQLTDTQLTGRGTDTLSNIEAARLTGGAGDNVLNAGLVNNLNVTLAGAEGNDTLKGGAKADTLYGEQGADRLESRKGNDRLYGNLGDDRLFAGDGNDTLKGGGDNDILKGENGDDTINGGAGSDRLVETGNVNFTLTDTTLVGNGSDTITQVELVELTGGAGNNTLDAELVTTMNVTLDGALGNDTLYGGTKSDVLLGREGNDLLAGRDGDDRLNGSMGSDRLYGELGNDTLNGGAGNDLLNGGQGADVLVLDLVSGTDTIRGFNRFIDLIGLPASLGFSDLSISDNNTGTATLIRDTTNNERLLAILDGVMANQITADNFTNI